MFYIVGNAVKPFNGVIKVGTVDTLFRDVFKRWMLCSEMEYGGMMCTVK